VSIAPDSVSLSPAPVLDQNSQNHSSAAMLDRPQRVEIVLSAGRRVIAEGGVDIDVMPPRGAIVEDHDTPNERSASGVGSPAYLAQRNYSPLNMQHVQRNSTALNTAHEPAAEIGFPSHPCYAGCSVALATGLSHLNLTETEKAL
jgi:hypothetical protein